MEPNNKLDFANLTETVINGGYCIGCGACAVMSNSAIKMDLDDYGRYVPTVTQSCQQQEMSASVSTVCPFSEQASNEDQISQKLFSQDCQYHPKIGYYLKTYAGYAAEGDFRQLGSSGGIGTWIVSELLSQGLIDGVIHVKQRNPSDNDGRLFHYQLSTTVEEVRQGAKTRYYPIEMSEVIELIRNRPGNYAIVGIPCFLKAIRLLSQQDKILAERIKFCVGLICGHLKSTAFAKMLAWQCGIAPEQLLSIDFRYKLPEANANKYGIKVVGKKEGKLVSDVQPVKDLYGSDWGLGFFKYKACDYCDDVVAETADITVGDAWLPQYVNDSLGTNVLIIRNPVIHNLIKQATAEGRLELDEISAEDVVRSQASGFRHRREGLAYRLYLCDRQQVWHPKKRIAPNAKHLTHTHQKRFEMRVLLTQESHIQFKAALDSGQFSLFRQTMDNLVFEYRKLYQVSPWQKRMKPLFSALSHFPRKVISKVSKIKNRQKH